ATHLRRLRADDGPRLAPGRPPRVGGGWLDVLVVVDLIGYLASLGAVSMWVPQAVRAHRRRHDPAALAGLSLLAFGTAVVFNGLLLAYGIGSDSMPVAVSG